jgi:K+-sensing histidine kinase KdpD
MRFFTTLYVLLLAYIIAALVFWGLSLNKQSKQIFYQEKLLLIKQTDSARHPSTYIARLHDLEIKRNRRGSQYIGEGSTFLLIILIGAAVVYSSFKRSTKLSKQQNNFMLAVTHELKSPIAAIKLNLQTLQRHELEEAKKDMLVKRSIQEANRLNDLCNNMLIASQMEGRQYVAAREPLNFTELVETSLRDYTVRYPNRFEESVIANCNLNGDKLLLHMAINNLLENAVKYTPEDKPITVSLTVKNNVAIFQVADMGSGISNKEKRKIFNKFYRVGNEETRKTKGTGLGLYLTSKIVKQHNGIISVKDNTPSGAIFEICLPTG